MRSSIENLDESVDETIKPLELEGLQGAWGSQDDGSNAIILQDKRKGKKEGINQDKVKGSAHLSKSQKRKLKKLQEEKEKRVLELKSIRILEKYKIQDGAYFLLRSSANMGQVETMREKRRRALQFSKAGLEVPQDDPPFKKRSTPGIYVQSGISAKLNTGNDKSHFKQDNDNHIQLIVERDTFSSYGTLDNPPFSTSSGMQGADSGSNATLLIRELVNKSSEECMKQGQNNSTIASWNFAGEKSKPQDLDDSQIDCQDTGIHADHLRLKFRNDRTLVHVSRPHEVESKRGDLPIVMMEQEIMETINENSTVIICGETGCGKTTQVPQFLYEAGFASSKGHDRKGIIGVTQPRRVAVLATAKRIAFELGLHLGKEVGFQVRHDKKIGENCSIKFMTDGILLREVQSDFLLKRYSIIILDEAHERSLNTDILIGMLSRIIQIRQKLYVEQQQKVLSGMKISPENLVTQLRLVLMSATLRVEDFVSDKRLFCDPPPIIEVPTRQFPVTTHFSKRTEIVDYVGQAYRKVMLIHKKLPTGGILVFVTGQREVEYLCKKLRKASQKLIERSSKGKSDVGVARVSVVDCVGQDPDMKDISEAFEIQGHSRDQQTGRFGSCDEELDDLEKDSSSFDSDTDDELLVDSDEEEFSNHETPEKTDNVADVLGEAGTLSSLKAAFESLSGNASNTNKGPFSSSPVDESEPSPVNGKKQRVDGICPGALHVLPLYAMLPAAAQLRVFEEIGEGKRLVVVATNVAETSLTIPGIKYVVDTGREKVKNYNHTNGMATYEVQWISKASAAQRAGRAGRTGPGHCYRLYSSAVFNNIFPDFSSAEITKIPVDGVVLIMKFMGIDKVANFPFPTPPESAALVEAEHCLKALGALDNKGRLTSIGKAMAQYPMSPRHSRMLLTIIQVMRTQQGYARANLILSYAVAAAAALSFTSPFIIQFGGSNGSNGNMDQDGTCRILGDEQGENNAKQLQICTGKIPLDQQEKQRQKKFKAMAKEARAKFCNPSSDALTIAYALQAFDLAENPVEFCRNNALHFKTMDEMSKLRKQLLQLIFHRSKGGELQQDFLWTHGNVEDIECVWRIRVDKHPLLLNEEELLGQAICAGWADRVAMRIRTVSESSDKDRKGGNALRYQSCNVNETVFLHRWSSVSPSAPEFLVYNELLQTKRPYMHGVTRIKSDWLVTNAKSLCTFSAPLMDPKPYYDPLTDQVLCWVSPTFGPHLWQLPLHSIPIKDDVLRVSTFAYSLLVGNVLPCLKSAQRFMAAPPASILKPEAAGQRRVGNLLNKLKMQSRMIDSRATLRETWNKNPQELHSEIRCWFQAKYHSMFEELWVQMHREVMLEAEELFLKRLKKEKYR